LANIPTLGVAKNLYQMDNIFRDDSHKNQIKSLVKVGDWFPIISKAGEVLAVVHTFKFVLEYLNLFLEHSHTGIENKCDSQTCLRFGWTQDWLGNCRMDRDTLCRRQPHT
jgi:hypothetical protein